MNFLFDQDDLIFTLVKKVKNVLKFQYIVLEKIFTHNPLY